ncbi:hypothetical protein, partial [uncultured Butyricimonas sp.]|uniref:hypothetical protein n=1 Tax=uncultured Butyricimonas sp. TaxID=1268785 RepID=UPI0026DB907B
EQRTENPCVPGSIPGGTTERERVTKVTLFSFILILCDFQWFCQPICQPKYQPIFCRTHLNNKTLLKKDNRKIHE